MAGTVFGWISATKRSSAVVAAGIEILGNAGMKRSFVGVAGTGFDWISETKKSCIGVVIGIGMDSYFVVAAVACSVLVVVVKVVKAFGTVVGFVIGATSVVVMPREPALSAEL